MKTYTVAILGATGAVGQEMMKILAERNFPVGKLVPLASKRSAGKKLVFIGDGNNMANSLIVGGIKTGMEVAVACPKSHQPDAEIMKWAAENGTFTCTDDILAACRDADVLYTDVWASMGQEAEAEQRKKEFAAYQVNERALAAANPGCMVLHCLPAHRGEEITDAAFEAHANEIFDEAENRLHAQKAVMVRCMAK